MSHHHRSTATAVTSPPSRAALAVWANSARSAFEGQLKEFVEIPSVSADPAHKPDIRKQVEAAVALLQAQGATFVQVVRTRGNPVVFARFEVDPAAPTGTLYDHLDVQPANRKEEKWKTDPFRFTRKGLRYFGRGTTDDKGPAIAALLGLRHGQRTGARVNVNVLWELEEEIGSPHFEEALRKLGAKARTDVVLVSDTIWVRRGQPAMPAGLRGLLTFQLTLQTGEADTHSGITGGEARNPVSELCSVAAACVDGKTGRCKIPGFYTGVIKPTLAELGDFLRCGFSVKGFMRDFKLKSVRERDALEAMKRLWAMPTFEIHSVVGGYTGPGVKTVIPGSAELKISIRLVPGQDPARIARLVTAHVRRENPDVVVTPGHALRAFRGATTGPYAEAIRAATKLAFGRDPMFTREGGSIGAVLTMQERLKAPVMFLGLSLPSHGYHAPNENFDWGQGRGGMMAFAALAHELAATGARK